VPKKEGADYTLSFHKSKKNVRKSNAQQKTSAASGLLKWLLACRKPLIYKELYAVIPRE